MVNASGTRTVLCNVKSCGSVAVDLSNSEPGCRAGLYGYDFDFVIIYGYCITSNHPPVKDIPVHVEILF